MLSLEQTILLIKSVGKFTNKKDVRDFVRYVYVVDLQSSTELLATNGHIAIKVKIMDSISQLENTSLKIKKVDAVSNEVAKINKVFNVNSEYKSTEITFNPDYLHTIFSSIKSICGILKNRLIDIEWLAGGNDSLSKFVGNNGYVSIEAAIMPMRKRK
jgi:negative regulator of sigma E activity